jgi:hypothetical protein
VLLILYVFMSNKAESNITSVFKSTQSDIFNLSYQNLDLKQPTLEAVSSGVYFDLDCYHFNNCASFHQINILIFRLNGGSTLVDIAMAHTMTIEATCVKPNSGHLSRRFSR